MIDIITIAAKYLIIIMCLIYTLSCFTMFRPKNKAGEPRQRSISAQRAVFRIPQRTVAASSASSSPRKVHRAVSYTHLDVYKRQVKGRVADDVQRLGLHAANQQSATVFPALVAEVGKDVQAGGVQRGKDVYKRQ